LDDTENDQGRTMSEDLVTIDQTAHLLGNYHKYYTFHSAESRINLLAGKDVFLNLWKSQQEPETFVYLDIGCNEGDLSHETFRLIRSELPSSVKVILCGADLDGELITLAREKFSSEENSNCYFYNVNFMIKEQVDELRERLQKELNISTFNLISIFSTTMWIHINHGDSGLRDFFLTVKSLLTPSSGLLVEPQPAKCYTNAARRCRKMRIEYPPFLEKIDKTKAQDLITQFIGEDVELRTAKCFGTEDWGRSLTLYSQ
jgi:SAM-dependent methyltransferase